MSNKVTFSLILSVAFLAVFGFFLLRKTNPKEVKNNDLFVGKITKIRSKNKTKSISRRIIREEETESGAGTRRDLIKAGSVVNPDTTPSEFARIKNDRKIYRTRTISYSDPINDRVLGNPRWAATTSKKELELVEKAFETPPEDPEIISLSRQRSIDVIKPIVNTCYVELLQVEPAAKGRIVVEWMAGKNGKISDLNLGPNVDLRFPSFTTCILERTRNLTFDSNAEDIFVQYPFAFLEDN